MARVAIGLGSNRGARLELLRFGVARLDQFVDRLQASSVFETQPMYHVDQGAFLNACCVGVTHLTPRQLLSALLEAERVAGRSREGPRFGPRLLDLDLLLYGDCKIDEDELVVPHPRMHERPFVLCPLAEIAPRWPVPADSPRDIKSVEELLADVDTSTVVQTLHDLLPSDTIHA